MLTYRLPCIPYIDNNVVFNIINDNNCLRVITIIILGLSNCKHDYVI